MKRMVMWMVAFFGLGGCTMDPTTAATAIGAVTGMVDLLRKFGVLTMIALALVLQGGCAGKTGSVSGGSSGMAAQQAIDVVASAEENGLQATAIVEADVKTSVPVKADVKAEAKLLDKSNEGKTKTNTDIRAGGTSWSKV